jgi:uncharacterized protein (TIGR02145 family)
MRKKIFVLKFLLLIFMFGFLISCQKDDPVQGVNSISVKYAPLKIDYYEGESLDIKGLMVMLHMDNDEEEYISYTDFTNKGITCFPDNGEELSATLTAITISHIASEMSVDQNINVSDIEASDISIKTVPEKVYYNIGEYVDLSGLVVTISMNNGETEDIAFPDFTSKGITCFPENSSVITSESGEVNLTHTESGKSTIFGFSFPLSDITDIEGNSYAVIKIGGQIWMAENLRTTKYNDGTPITLIDSDWDYPTTEAYCWYNNDETTNSALYNWYVLENENLCPVGWHVPNDNEWKVLEGVVDSKFNVGDSEWDIKGERGLDAGMRLKLTSGWIIADNSINGTNNYRFNANLAGVRWSNGWWSDDCQWWVSDSSSDELAWRRILHHNQITITRTPGLKSSGYSIRCIKDSE